MKSNQKETAKPAVKKAAVALKEHDDKEHQHEYKDPTDVPQQKAGKSSTLAGDTKKPKTQNVTESKPKETVMSGAAKTKSPSAQATKSATAKGASTGKSATSASKSKN